MLMPKRVKYRKRQKGKMRGTAYRGGTLNFGSLWPSSSGVWAHNESANRSCPNCYDKTCEERGKIWLRIFPDKPVSKKPLETRMGKGKGNPEFWVAVVKPGRMLYEMEGVSEPIAKEAFRLAAHKLSVATRFVTK